MAAAELSGAVFAFSCSGLPLPSAPTRKGAEHLHPLSTLIILFMVKRYFIFLVLPFLLAFAPPKLKKITITKEVALSVPEDFVVMPDQGIAREYPAARKPLAVFTSPSGQVDISVNQRANTFPDNDLDMLKPFYKASIQRMFTEVQFLREEIQTINGRKFLVFEIVSTLRDERQTSNLAPVRKYTIIQYTFVKDQMYIFSLNAPVQLQKEWQPTAQAIMATAVVK